MNDPDGNWPKWIKNIAKTVKKIVKNIVEGVKNSEFDFVNHVSKGHVTSPKLMLDGGPFFGKIGFSTTTTKKNKEEGVLHSYVDIGNDANMCGVGVNVAGWLGAGIGASSEGNIYAQAQATPWVHAQVSLGFDGLGGVVGFDVGDTSYDFEVKAGLGLILIFVVPYALPNGQAGTAYAQ